MKNPDEIKKGLECCTIKDGCICADCLGCPYYDPNKFNRVCDTSMHNDALAYIQQLEAANAELLNLCKQLEAKCHQLERERDAAVCDLHRAVNFEAIDCESCFACRWVDAEGRCTNREYKETCNVHDNDHWEWRGVKEE